MGGDQLVGTTSDSFEYDSIGNPTRYGYMDGSSPFLWDSGVEMTWEGRQMQTFRRFYTHYDVETELVYYNQLAFTYNADGIRTSKTVDGVKHTYVLEGSQILAETWEKNGVQYYLVYLYDESGAPIGMKYRTSAYAEDVFDCFFFEKNLQGDIIAVYNSSGTPICTYKYDAWGAFTTTVTSGVTTLERSIANTYNPFRYRGYFYDVESGYYYLQSRYYNPNWGRFLNADGYVSTGTGLLGFNMYAYCNNNPVMGYDPTGEWDWGKFWDRVVNVVAGISGFIAGTGAFIETLIETEGDASAAFIEGVETGVNTFSRINNTVNSVYYLFATPQALPETESASAYVNEGYIDRWDRLKHAKSQTKEWYYSKTARDYYGEYSAHMYGWMVLGWADQKGYGIFSGWAEHCKSAEIDVGKPDSRPFVNIISNIFGGLGI